MDQTWKSDFAAGFDAIVAADLAPAEAVISMIAYETAHHLTLPDYYISTAISSAGHRREPKLAGKDGIPEAIRRNNRTGSLMMRQICASPSSLVTARNSMVPTELGYVKSWSDLEYLAFYFAWMSGLSAEGAAWFADEIFDPSLAAQFAPAKDRSLTNDQRWPAYEAFTEIAIAKITQARSRSTRTRSGGCRALVQLVDVELSLGCRAETLFAEMLALDVIAPAFGPGMAPDLAKDIRRLRTLKATVGIIRQPAELVATTLRRG